MGFTEDHPAVARVRSRLWPSLITALVALAAAGTAPLAATDNPPGGAPDAVAAECETETQQAIGPEQTQPQEDDCEHDADGEQDAEPVAPADSQTDETPDGGDPSKAQPEPDPGKSLPAAQPTGAEEPPAPAPAAPATDPAHSAAPAVQAPETDTGAQEPPAGPSGAPTPSAAEAAPAAEQRRRSAQAPRSARRERRAAADRGRTKSREQVYFPPVSIDWLSLTPLAPPAFGSGEATRFPGPLFLLPIYQAASVQYGIPWEVLAAINEIETGFGSNVGVSSAGALGWMQFMPATWSAFGVDANRDGQKNPHDPVDAIFSAARYLRASGAAADLPRAIFAYNHANWYVERVLARAKAIGDLPEDLLATLVAEGRERADVIRRFTGSPGLLDPAHRPRTIGRILLLDDERLRDLVLADERVEVYGCGREDIASGVVDRRVLETLAYLSSRGLRPAVTSLRCGHGYYTSAGSVSEHSHGAAMDIARINGTPILGHQGEGSVTDETIRALLELRGGLRPHQIISLMSFTGASNAFAMADHDDHIHVGFAPLRKLRESR